MSDVMSGRKRPAPVDHHRGPTPAAHHTLGATKRYALHNSNIQTSPFYIFFAADSKKKKKLADKILPQKVRDLVPESQAYMDLLAFERKLDSTIMRKRLDIQEALKRPMKVGIVPIFASLLFSDPLTFLLCFQQKRKLRIFISNTFYPARTEGDGMKVSYWNVS